MIVSHFAQMLLSFKFVFEPIQYWKKEFLKYDLQ